VVRKFLIAASALMAVAAMTASAAQAVAVNVYGTTDITDSNLFAGLMEPAYHGASGGNTISYTALGTGAAINAAEVAANHVDALMVHSPSLEAAFVGTGDSVEPLGRPIFYNDYVIVGPNGTVGTADPAGVIANAPNDAAKAFSLIATAGGAGHATFLTRNDASGTNTQEQVIWCLANSSYGTTVHTVTSGHCAPGATSFPSWYAPTGLGQGPNLTAANSCATGTYPNGECYTIVDRGTFLYHKNTLHDIPNLEIVSNLNSATAPGGASLLTNPFHAYAVNVSPGQPAAALNLIKYVAGDNPFTGSNFQSLLANWPGAGQVSNIPDGFPTIASSTFPPPSPCVAQNSNITVGAKFVYAPPVALPIASMPVYLDQGGVDIAGPVNTDASGNVSFTTNVGTTDENYSLRTALFDDNDTGIKSRFSPNNNKQLGTNLNGHVDVCP
jgi:ABC-type tungstate transport system permease subunit